MKARELHDLLISLVIRVLGVWILFTSVENFFALVDQLYAFAFHEARANTLGDIVEDIVILASHVVVAGYFILGAPPFLKWATRDKS